MDDEEINRKSNIRGMIYFTVNLGKALLVSMKLFHICLTERLHRMEFSHLCCAHLYLEKYFTVLLLSDFEGITRHAKEHRMADDSTSIKICLRLSTDTLQIKITKTSKELLEIIPSFLYYTRISTLPMETQTTISQ